MREEGREEGREHGHPVFFVLVLPSETKPTSAFFLKRKRFLAVLLCQLVCAAEFELMCIPVQQ